MNDDQIYEVEECMLTGAAKTITNTDARNKTTFGRCIFRSALADLFFCEVGVSNRAWGGPWFDKVVHHVQLF